MIELDEKEVRLVIQALANNSNLAAIHHKTERSLADAEGMLRRITEKDEAEKARSRKEMSGLRDRLAEMIEACENLQETAEVARKNYQALLDEKTGLAIENASLKKETHSLEIARNLHQRNYQEAADARDKLQIELTKIKELKTKAERELAAETKRMGDVIRKQEQHTNELTEKYRKNQELVLELLRNSITAGRTLDQSLIRDVFRILEVT